MHSFPPDASHFNFKPDIIQLLPSFHGLDIENSYLHLREFIEVCDTYNHSYKTRPGCWPGQGPGSRVLGVNPGQLGLTRINPEKF
jgi:hypothetical protein